ncbi:unnamed protein product [Arabidopsis halleri]
MVVIPTEQRRLQKKSLPDSRGYTQKAQRPYRQHFWICNKMGLPSDREQYIHRLGRTERKGKEGEGVLLLAPWEEYFLSSVKDLPITKSSLPPIDHEAVNKVWCDHLDLNMRTDFLLQVVV